MRFTTFIIKNEGKQNNRLETVFLNVQMQEIWRFHHDSGTGLSNTDKFQQVVEQCPPFSGTSCWLQQDNDKQNSARLTVRFRVQLIILANLQSIPVPYWKCVVHYEAQNMTNENTTGINFQNLLLVLFREQVMEQKGKLIPIFFFWHIAIIKFSIWGWIFTLYCTSLYCIQLHLEWELLANLCILLYRMWLWKLCEMSVPNSLQKMAFKYISDFCQKMSARLKVSVKYSVATYSTCISCSA